jgi:hypothetical protein
MANWAANGPARPATPELTDLRAAAQAVGTALSRPDSALPVVISGGLPRRLSRAVTTAACCLLRRPSAALTACRGRGRPIPACQSATYRPATPAQGRRALSQAQTQIRGAGPAPSRRRPGNASAAQRPTPPRQLSRRDRSKLPHPSRPRQPARATAAPYRQARHHVARPRYQRRDATRARSGQYRPATTQGNTRSAQKAQNHCSARLTSYQAATRIRYLALPKYSYLYSNYALELGRAKRARTADLLHAMKGRHFH